MTRRRAFLVGGVVVTLVAVVVAAWAYRSSHHASSDCDTVRSLIAYNTQFTEQMKASAGTDQASAVTPKQYREWATQVKEYADRISDPDLAWKASAAADAAGKLADLVPRYRAKPDDASAARDYAGLGIEYGNAINRLEYACLPAG